MNTTVLRAPPPRFSDIVTALHLHQKRLRLQPHFAKVGTGLSDRRVTSPMKPWDDEFLLNLRVLYVKLLKNADI